MLNHRRLVSIVIRFAVWNWIYQKKKTDMALDGNGQGPSSWPESNYRLNVCTVRSSTACSASFFRHSCVWFGAICSTPNLDGDERSTSCQMVIKKKHRNAQQFLWPNAAAATAKWNSENYFHESQLLLMMIIIYKSCTFATPDRHQPFPSRLRACKSHIRESHSRSILPCAPPTK